MKTQEATSLLSSQFIKSSLSISLNVKVQPHVAYNSVILEYDVLNLT
jgi:hypothetical protein